MWPMSAHGSRAVLCCEMPLQALKMSPTDQAFDCVAAEIALDVTAGLKHLRLHALENKLPPAC
jgi:hypothetical protein